MIVLGLLTGLVALIAGGLGITLLVTRGTARLNVVEMAALSWLFGSGLVSLLLWLGGLIVSGPPLQIAVAAALLAIAAVGVARARRNGIQLAMPKPQNGVEWTLAAVVAIEILIMFYGAAGHGLGWDGLFNWEVKARYAFENAGVLPGAYFSSATRTFTHPAYPLLIPFTELWFYLSIGEAHQFWIKFIFPLYYAAGAILLATAAARLTQQRWAGLLSAALLFFVPFLSNSPGTATSGYVDVPLGVIYLATIAYLILFAVNGDTSALRLYAVSLALLPWTKREGAFLWLIAAGCGALVIWRWQRSWRRLLLLLPGAVILVAWRIFVHAMHTIELHDYAPLTVAGLQANAARIGPVGRTLAAEMLDPQRWSLFWPGVVLALGYLAFRAPDRRLLLLLVALAAPMMLYATFMLNTEPAYTAHFAGSFTRLMLHVTPLAWLGIALAISWRGTDAPPAVTTSSGL